MAGANEPGQHTLAVGGGAAERLCCADGLVCRRSKFEGQSRAAGGPERGCHAEHRSRFRKGGRKGETQRERQPGCGWKCAEEVLVCISRGGNLSRSGETRRAGR